MKHHDLVRGAVASLSMALALPVVSGPVRAAKPPAGAPQAACSCTVAFDQAVQRVEGDYAGFQIKVDAERREAYDRFKAALRTDAAGAGVDRCEEVLDLYVGFFQDYHLFFLRNSKAGGPGGTTARPWTEVEARAEIERHRERLDPIEGLWYSRTGRYAVLREPGTPAGTFSAVRLVTDGKPSSELAVLFRRTSHGSYRAIGRDPQGVWQANSASLYRGGALLVFGAEGWGRLQPAVQDSRLDPADPQAPSFARLNAGALYLSLPSFSGEYKPTLDALVEARGAEIGKADGLIIDLRGNPGGNTIFSSLAPYLFTGPFKYIDANLILASPLNLREIEEIRRPLGAEGAELDPVIQRMKENPGKLVPFRDDVIYTPPVLSPGPRRVVLLVDRGVGSAAEAMVESAGQSQRVIVVGENTKGNIDYQNVNVWGMGCGDYAYAIGIPLFTRTRDLPAGALDLIGIAPDIPIPLDQMDPVAFALRLIAAK